MFYLQKKFFKQKIKFSADKRLANKIDPTSYVDKIDEVKKIVEKKYNFFNLDLKLFNFLFVYFKKVSLN